MSKDEQQDNDARKKLEDANQVLLNILTFFSSIIFSGKHSAEEFAGWDSDQYCSAEEWHDPAQDKLRD